MATALHSTRTRFFDKCGKPLCGGFVHTYQVGTTTEKPTYTDASKTAMNTNPVVLDSIGSASVFLDGAYRVRVLDRNGVLVEDIAFIESWISATEKDDIYQAIGGVNTALTEHVENTENPHSVTKAQIGLGDVDNTADIDKPISNATKTYIDEKDALKADAAITYTKTEVDTKVNSVSGGYIGAYLTLAELQAKTGMTTGQVAKVMNDATVGNNGDYYYNGSIWVKGYDALTDAKAYVNEISGDLKSLTTTNKTNLVQAINEVVPNKPNLGDENLNTVTNIGIYRQIGNAKATIANNYPTDVNGAGILEVINNNGLIIQEYTTWYNRKFRRTKYGTFDFLTWQEVPNSTDIVLYYKPNLGTEDLDTVLTSGIYRQIIDANATTEKHYPTSTNGAGILEVINRGNLVIQEYTTWYGRKFWRTKYSTYAFVAWQEVASVSSINTPYKGKNIAWFGDSIVEGNNHPSQIATLLGATVSKFGFASHTMAQYVGSPLGRDKGSMYRFAKAINTGDWIDVIAGGEWVRDNLSDDNMPQINAMAATDWTKVDYIVIAFGTNDIYSVTPLGTLSDAADSTGSTFVGATKYVIEQIQSKYPHIQIVFISPVFRTRWFQTPAADRPEQNSDTLLDPQGKKYTDYVDALLAMRDIYHVPVFDFYRSSGLNSLTWPHYLSDGVHPNSNGINLWTKKITAFMLSH